MRDWFVEQLLRMANSPSLPEKAFLGDVCKVDDVYYVYQHQGWLSIDDALKLNLSIEEKGKSYGCAKCGKPFRSEKPKTCGAADIHKYEDGACVPGVALFICDACDFMIFGNRKSAD